MEKFDYFREKTGKNLNYNYYFGKLIFGCERSVIKIFFFKKMYIEVRGYLVYFICRILIVLFFSNL